jgi:hypothetical protein
VAAASADRPAAFDLVRHGVGQGLDRRGVLDAEAVVVEEDVEAAEAQFAVTSEESQAGRAKGPAPQPEGGPRQRRERLLVQVRLAATPGAGDSGPQRLEDLLQFGGDGVAGLGGLVQPGVEDSELLGQRLPVREEPAAAMVRGPCYSDGNDAATTGLGHRLVPRTFGPVCERPSGVARPVVILPSGCDILAASGRFDVDSPQGGAEPFAGLGRGGNRNAGVDGGNGIKDHRRHG